MPRIPTQPGPQVRTIADQTPFQSPNVPAGAFGGQIGAAIAGLGGATQRLGAALEQQAEDDSRRKAKNLENQYRARIRELEFGTDKEDGYYSTLGGEAVDGFEGFKKVSKQARQDILGNIDDPDVAAFFNNSSGTLLQASLEGGQRHQLSQRQNAQAQASSSRIEAATTDAALKNSDPKFVRDQESLIRNESIIEGQRLGLDNQGIDLLKDEAVSNFWFRVIQQTAETDTGRGKEMFEQESHKLLPGAFQKVNDILKDYEQLDQINEETGQIMSQEDITEVDARVQAREIDDPDVQKGVLRQINNEFAARKSDRIEAERITTDDAFTMIQNGGRVDDVRRMDPDKWAAWNAVPGLPEQLRTAETQRLKGEQFAPGVHPEIVQTLGNLPAAELLLITPAMLKGRLNEQETNDILRLQAGVRAGLAKTEGAVSTFNANQAALKETSPKRFDWLNDKSSQEEIDRAHQLSNELAAWREDFTQLNQKSPTPQEVQNQASALWQEHQPDGLFNDVDGAELRRILSPERRAIFTPELDDLQEGFPEGIIRDLEQRGIKNPSTIMVRSIAGAMMMNDFNRVFRIMGEARQQQAAPPPTAPRRAPPPAQEVGPGLEAQQKELEVGEPTPLPDQKEPTPLEPPQEPLEEEEVSPGAIDQEEVIGQPTGFPGDNFEATGGISFTDRVAQIESSGNPNAEASTSSATGLFQFIDSTWMEEIKQHAPELMEGRSREEILELRKDPEVATLVFEGFTADNARGLEGSGLESSPRNLYLAHFLGLGGARSALKQAPSKSVPARVARSNPFLRGKDIQFLLDWAGRKIRGE